MDVGFGGRINATINVSHLNAMISVFGSAQLLKNVMETWEAFTSFNLTADYGTYEALCEATSMNQSCFTKVWAAFISSEFDPSTRMCDLALETYMRFEDLHNVLRVLEHMHIKKISLHRDLTKEAARHPAIERLLRNMNC